MHIFIYEWKVLNWWTETRHMHSIAVLKYNSEVCFFFLMELTLHVREKHHYICSTSYIAEEYFINL